MPDFPSVDGLIGWPLHQVVVDDPSPGPAARLEAVRRHFKRSQASPWHAVGELCLQDGYPAIVGIGVLARSRHPWAVVGERPELLERMHNSAVSGTCMNPVFRDRVAVFPERLPLPGEPAAIWWRQPELGDFVKWIFAPIPPRDRWDAYPDAVVLWGEEECAGAVVASCEASIGCFGEGGGPFGPDLRDWKSPNPQSTQQPRTE